MTDDHVIRISDQAYTIIVEYQKLHKISTFKEAHDKFILEDYHNRMYLKYFLDHRTASLEEPQCVRRFITEGKYYCGLHAPRAVEIVSLDLCHVCKLKAIDQWRTTAKRDKLEELLTPEERDRLDKEVSKPSKLEYKPAIEATKAKKIYCPDGGLFLDPESMCPNCIIDCGKNPRYHHEPTEPTA